MELSKREEQSNGSALPVTSVPYDRFEDEHDPQDSLGHNFCPSNEQLAPVTHQMEGEGSATPAGQTGSAELALNNTTEYSSPAHHMPHIAITEAERPSRSKWSSPRSSYAIESSSSAADDARERADRLLRPYTLSSVHTSRPYTNTGEANTVTSVKTASQLRAELEAQNGETTQTARRITKEKILAGVAVGIFTSAISVFGAIYAPQLF